MIDNIIDIKVYNKPYMILTKYKNTLLKLIQESGLDVSLFTAENNKITDKPDKYFIIKLNNSPIYFAVGPSLGSFNSFYYNSSQFKPGFPFGEYFYTSDSIGTLSIKFNTWLNEVVKPYIDNLNTPDLWEYFKKTRTQTKNSLITPEEFETFSDDEKQQIRLSLDDFKLSIINNFKPNKEALIAINNRLDYLSTALDKHNKFDWKGIAISTLIAISVELALDPEKTQTLFQIFQQIFTNVVYLLS